MRSRLTSKFQATIPLPVRRALGLKSGDQIEFAVEDGRAVITRAAAEDHAYLQSVEGTLNEWLSEADDDAFKHL
jgi:antitoxin PrlF